MTSEDGWPAGKEPPYERVPHTADLAIRVWGRDLPGLFANAAWALSDMLAAPPATMDIAREVTLRGMDVEDLLVAWLNELIYLHEVEGETYARFEVLELSPVVLRATIRGGPTARERKAIKAATYHDLRVSETAEGVEATVVFDV